jgi:hypothetical protein
VDHLNARRVQTLMHIHGSGEFNVIPRRLLGKRAPFAPVVEGNDTRGKIPNLVVGAMGSGADNATFTPRELLSADFL